MTAISELPIIEPTLVKEGVRIDYNSNNKYYHKSSNTYYFADTEWKYDDRTRICKYSPITNQVTIIKEFDPSEYDIIKIYNADLKIVLFNIKNLETGETEIWSTDGSLNGTKRLLNATSIGPFNSLEPYYCYLDEVVMFMSGTEDDLSLWVTDGTEQGTYQTNIKDTEDYKLKRDISSTRNKFIYRTVQNNENTIMDIWSTDLTDNSHLYTGLKKENLWFYNDYKDVCFIFTFGVSDSIAYRPLMVTDGTEEGTFDLLANDTTYRRYDTMFVANDRLFFKAIGYLQTTIYSTDGTKEGTIEIAQETNDSRDIYFTVLDDKKIFYSNNRTNEIFITDGTSKGKKITGIGYFKESCFVILNGDKLYFSLAIDEPYNGIGQYEEEIWMFDITTESLTKLFTIGNLEYKLGLHGVLNDNFIFSIKIKDDNERGNSELYLYNIAQNELSKIHSIQENQELYSYQTFAESENYLLLYGQGSLYNRNDLYVLDKTLKLKRIGNKEIADKYISILGRPIKYEDKYLFAADYNGNGSNLYSIDLSNLKSSVSETSETSTNAFPNPVTNTLSIDGYAHTKISVYNINGTLVFSEKLNDSSIDVSKLLSGVYFIMNSNGEYITSFVKE